MSTHNICFHEKIRKYQYILQWFIYNFIPMRLRTRLGYIKWVLLENHCVHYRIFHYNFVSPGTRWGLKCESQSKKCEYGTRDAQVKKSLILVEKKVLSGVMSIAISHFFMKKCVVVIIRRASDDYQKYPFFCSEIRIMSQCTTKPIIRLVQPAKTQISLWIHAVWSESLLIACGFYNLRPFERVIHENLCYTEWM